MGRTRSSRGAVAKSDDIADPPELKVPRTILAKFIRTAAKALGSPYFYLVRTNGWKSLCLLTGLPPMQYATLLLLCGFITVTKQHDGTHHIIFEKDKFITYLDTYGLRGDIKQRDGCAEFTEGRITDAALSRDSSLREDDAPDDADNVDTKQNKHNRMHLLRVGKIPTGAKAPKHTAINNGEEPPRMNSRMYKAKNDLSESVSNMIFKYYMDEEKVAIARAARDWVLMKKPAPPKPTPPPPTSNDTNTPPSKEHEHEQPIVSPPTAGNNTYQSPSRISSKKAKIGAKTPPSITRMKQGNMEVDGEAITDEIRTKFPLLSSITSEQFEQFGSWGKDKRELYIEELRVLKERFDRPDVPDNIRKQYPCLSKLAPGIADRGKRVIGGVDLDRALMEGVLKETQEVANKHNQPWGFQYENGKHGARLISLPMSKTHDGKVKPNIERCILDMVTIVGDEYKDDVGDILLDYLLKHHKTKTLESLRDRKMIPQVMNRTHARSIIYTGPLTY